MKKYLFWLLIIWFVVILVALAYWVPLLSLIWVHIPDIALLLIILLASYSIGAQFFALIKLDFNTPLESLPFSAAFGLGFLAYSTLLFGLLGWLYKPLFYGILIIPIALSFKKLLYLFRGIVDQFRNALKKWATDQDYLSFIFLFFIFLSMGLSFILTLSPPKFFDILGYHLAIPNQYVIRGEITYFPHSALSNYPYLIHMLYTMALLLKGEILAKLLIFSFFPLMIILLYSVARRFWSAAAALSTAAFASTMPAAMQMATLTMVDLPLACFLLLGLFSLIFWIHSFSKKWLITSAIFCSLALGIKYTAFLYALGLLSFLLILYGLISKRGIKEIAKSLLIFIAIAFIISSPWWIKNYVYTENPLFPMFYKYLGGKNWSLQQEVQLRATTTIKVIKSFNPRLILSLPWLWIVEPLRFGILGSSPGVILFIFIPLALIYIRKERFIQFLLLYCIFYFIFWLFTFQQGRFALAMFFCMAIVLGYSFKEFINSIKQYWRLFFIAIFIVFIIVNYAILLENHKRIFDPLPYLVGLETKKQYLSRTIQVYPVISFINEHLPEDADILFVGETRNFYSKRKCICPSAHNTNPICSILKTAKTSSQIAQMLAEQGITHILFNQSETARLEKNFPVSFNWTSDDKTKLFSFFNSHCEVLFQERDVFLFAISKQE